MSTDERPTLELDLTHPEPIPEEGIERANELMRSGRLFRYGETAPGMLSDSAQLEKRFADLLGRKYAIGVNSCGAALFLALRSHGVQPGDPVLLNGYTLAPVPGAIQHAGATAALVEITENLTIDLEDLQRQAERTGARVLLLSHMRGHVSDMAAVMRICDAHGIRVIEDCAHTLGARFDGRPVGGFGLAACFSLQTFKHINSGEGGIIVTDDADLAARAILYSGSYMLYGQHAARPPEEAFEDLRAVIPNYSMRLSALAAAIALPQLDLLPERAQRMTAAYRRLETALRVNPAVSVIERDPREEFVGSSLQFRLPRMAPEQIAKVIGRCEERGLSIKWFGRERMEGFTSRPSQWGYFGSPRALELSERVLRSLCDLRIPPAMTERDADTVAAIISHACDTTTAHTGDR